MKKYYLQDSRSYVGNSLLFWRRGEAGYTTDPREAHVFTEEEAFKQNERRDTDIPWEKDYIDSKVKHHVDSQNVNLFKSLGCLYDKLHKDIPVKSRYRCKWCGTFQKERNYYYGCSHCGNNNRP